MKSPLVELCDQTFRIREHVAVPKEVAPVAVFHPEAVEMEYRQIYAAVTHPVNEGKYSLLIVIGREGSREPKSE